MTAHQLDLTALAVSLLALTVSVTLFGTAAREDLRRALLSFKAWRQRRRQARRARARVHLPTLQGQPGTFELHAEIVLEASSAVVAEAEVREALLQASDRWDWQRAEIVTLARVADEEPDDVEA